MAGTLGGEHRRLLTVVVASCDMLVACDLAGDLRRAVQWCQVADQFIDRYGCPFLYARCRTLYGSVLLAKGRWEEAETELLAAIRMAEGAGPGPRAEALARLADLRLRQGRLEEAEGLLTERGGGRAAARTAARRRSRPACWSGPWGTAASRTSTASGASGPRPPWRRWSRRGSPSARRMRPGRPRPASPGWSAVATAAR